MSDSKNKAWHKLLDMDNRIEPDWARREFVQKAMAAGAVLGLAGCATTQGPAGSKGIFSWHENALDNPLKLGLIGCGGRGSGAASNSIGADPAVTLYSMADVFEDKLKNSLKNLSNAHAKRINVPESRQHIGFDGYKRVIEECDVVILTTPPVFRPQHIQQAVAAGKHIFAEKPMAVDMPGVRKVIAAAKKAAVQKTALVSGFCWRYKLSQRAFYRKLAKGGIGNIQAVYANYNSSPLSTQPRKEKWTDMEWQLRNWQHMTWLSGDHIAEQACHSIDKIAWAFQQRAPKTVLGLGGRQMRELMGPESGNVYDHFTVIYEYEDGARGYHTCRQMPHCKNENAEYIHGSKGHAYINAWGPTMKINDEPYEYDGPDPDMYGFEHQEMYRSIREGEPINNGEQMTLSTSMAIAGRMAAYSGQQLSWDSIMNDKEDWDLKKYQIKSSIAVPPVAIPGNWRIRPNATPLGMKPTVPATDGHLLKG